MKTSVAAGAVAAALLFSIMGSNWATAQDKQAPPGQQAAPADQQAPSEVPPDQQQYFGPRVGGPDGDPPPDAPPPAQKMATIGAWEVQCGDGPPEKEGGKPVKSCGMVQMGRSDKSQDVGLSLIVVKMKQEGKELVMMRVMAPVGVYLPTGVALEIDGEAVGRVPFTRCRPQVCEAIAEASPPTLAKLKKGKAANFIIYDGPGEGIPLKISLDGFSNALTELDKYTTQ